MSIQESHTVAERAYLIWEQMGRPEGQALEHWLRAETELASASRPMPISEPAAIARRTRRKKA